MDDFKMEVNEHGDIKVTSHVEAVVISKEEQEQVLRIFNQLQEENDKLRELVFEYAKIANYFCEREGYCSRDFVAQCEYYKPQQCRLGKLNDELHELGIEVE